MENEIEIWKDIPGYEGYYQISNLGRVKGLPRPKRLSSGGFTMLVETIKKPHYQSDGYLQIGLSKDGKKGSFLLHRLVGFAFLEGDQSLEINHKDFNRDNCRADNLEWATRVENVDYSQRNKRYEGKYFRGLAKLSPEQVIEIRTIGRLIPRKTLAERYAVTCQTIGAIIRGLHHNGVTA
jgi:hypothetical protein